MKRVLITGASGFCGQHLSSFLRSKNYQVYGAFHQSKIRDSFWRGNLIPLDITNYFQVYELVEKAKPDLIFHLAAMSVPRFSWKREAETFNVNALGTLHLLEAIRKINRSIKLIFASTIQIYGQTFRLNRALDEKALMWPESPYAASKATAEVACLDYFHRFGLPIVIARPFNHLGRGQREYFVFADWCEQVAKAELGINEPVLEVGNLDAFRDFLHVEDVVKAYELLARKGKSGQIYNISSGRTVLLKEYIDFLCKKAKIRIRIEVQKERLRKNDPPVMSGKASKLRKLGWKPKHSAFDALEEMLDEARERVQNQK